MDTRLNLQQLCRAAVRLPMLLLLGLAPCDAPCAAAAESKLHLFIWSEYIDPAVVADFERLHTCRVVIDLYEDSESMLARLANGGDALYDVVVPSDNMVPVLIRRGLLAPLRKENLTGLAHLDPRFQRPDYDPDHRYTVPYQWGTMGILLRPTPGRTHAASWGLFFDPEQQPGPFVLIDSPRDLFAAAFRYLGHSVNTTNLARLRQAMDLLVAARKRALGFDGSVGGMNKVLSGVARAAIVYNGEAARALRSDTNLVYLLPREGSILWVDNLAIPARAPHRDLAEQFINFILEPTNAARIARYTRFATCNKDARALLDPADLNHPAIYPPEESFPRLEYLRDVGPAMRWFDEAWTRIKAR
jgi:spermidine/putrescine transport system substrate-binding protein